MKLSEDQRQWRILSTAMVLLVGLACSAKHAPVAEEGPGTDELAVEQAVTEMLVEFRTALAQGDVETVVNSYADDDRFFWAEDGAVRYESRSKVRAALDQLKQFGPASYTYGEPRVEVLSSELAMVYSEVETRFGDPADGGFAFSVAQTILVANLDGKWQFLSGHSSSPKARQ